MGKGRDIRRLFGNVNHVPMNPDSGSVTFRPPRKSALFHTLRQLSKKIENEPYLNFISLLKSYKTLGRFINGSIEDIYKDRNKLYFKKFFISRDLYETVKSDIEWVYKRNKNVKLTITKRGLIIYDNYRKNNFNALLFTIHSGTWMPKDVEKKQALTREKRLLEEDTDIHKIYGNLVIGNGGIWIDNKSSRFACDYNRPPEKAIYANNSEKWFDQLWKEDLTPTQRKKLMKGYEEFYFTLARLVDSYRFNIIFDAHSMKHTEDRPDISFGTKHVPRFYMPIIRSMQRKLVNMGYKKVQLNNPYSGGHVVEWLNKKFPDVFTFSMEVNKRHYMTDDRRKTIEEKLDCLSKNLTQIIDIGDESEV